MFKQKCIEHRTFCRKHYIRYVIIKVNKEMRICVFGDRAREKKRKKKKKSQKRMTRFAEKVWASDVILYEFQDSKWGFTSGPRSASERTLFQIRYSRTKLWILFTYSSDRFCSIWRRNIIVDKRIKNFGMKSGRGDVLVRKIARRLRDSCKKTCARKRKG